ncbi:MAG: hypothetical protein R6V85_00040 [Polyangia bacterium]
MYKKFLTAWLFAVASVALIAAGCNSEPETPAAPPGMQQAPPQLTVPGAKQQAPAPAMPQAPAAQQAPQGQAAQGAADRPPAAEPPPTPLVPIEEEDDDDEKIVKKKKGGGSVICKSIPGPETNGEELLGNYLCQLDTKDLPLGIKPPPVGCRIGTTADGSLAVMPTSRSAASMRGPITETKAAGFRVDGTYAFAGNKMRIGACMMRKGAGKFRGRGQGVLNKNRASKIKFTLTMTKQ